MEDRLGVKLLDASSGGARGGASRLTPAAQEFIERYHRMRRGLDEQVKERFLDAFDA